MSEKLISQGKCEVYVYGDKFSRTVYRAEGQQRFFVKIKGELIEVYLKTMCFSTSK